MFFMTRNRSETETNFLNVNDTNYIRTSYKCF